MNKDFKKYYNYVFSFAIRLTKNRDLAKDLTQDVMYKAYKNKFKFDGVNIKQWLSTIVYNTYIDSYRKNKGYFFLEIKEEIVNKNYYNNAISNLTINELDTRINKHLKDDYKELINLRLQGYSNLEISEIINRNQSTTRWLIADAMKKLKEII